MSKKEDLYKTIHHQTGIDVRNYVEPASIKKRGYTSIHFEKMEKTNQYRVNDYLRKSGYRIESNGGYGTAIWLK